MIVNKVVKTYDISFSWTTSTACLKEERQSLKKIEKLINEKRKIIIQKVAVI